MEIKKIVVIGGGTGSFTVLRGLKKYPQVELTAIVNMVDDGGSTGILRDELGVLPPGDIRQCLVALSESSSLMRELMNYRFVNGSLQGHSLGNLLITALEKTTGSFENAVEEVGKILAIKGNVVPVTTDKCRLVVELNSGELIYGEKNLYNINLTGSIKKIFLNPIAKANPKALTAIKEADLIIIGPGSIYSSLIPNFLVSGIKEALSETKAKKMFIVNLMNKKGKTDNFTVKQHIEEMERYLNTSIFDYILYNTENPALELLEKYAFEGDIIKYEEEILKDTKCIPIKAFSSELKEIQKGDLIKRNLIRHDSDKLAKIIIEVLNFN